MGKPGFFKLLPLAFVGLALAGCNTSTSALDDAGQSTSSEDAAQQAAATQDAAKNSTVVRRSGASKRGTYVRILVNTVPVTNYDINRRAAFLKLRRVGGNRTEKATEEMIEQNLKMQEAQRLGVLASEAEVNQAFARFAAGNRSTPARISRDLNSVGVGAKHFKDYIRAQISWNRATSRRFQSDTRSMSQSEAIFEIKQSGEDKPETTEYVIQQVIFVVPQSKRKARLAARRTEANAMRQRFTNCDDTINLAKQLRDVSVFNRGRVLEPELPPEWKDGIIAAGVGETTKVQDTEKGVEFIAVCSKRTVSDDRAAQVVKQTEQFEEFSDKGDKVSKDYLNELRERASIVYR